MDNLEKFVKKERKYVPKHSRKFLDKWDSKYLPCLLHYKKSASESLFGVGLGVATLAGGFVVNETPITLVGAVIASLFGYSRYYYKRKLNDLNIKLEDDIEILRKGGMIDD